MPVSSFRELIVWQRAMELVEEVYKVSAAIPATERFGLTHQMQRAAVSIPSNIAEGRQRKTRKDYAQFLHIADGSAAELETQLLLAARLYRLTNTKHAHELLGEVQKIVGAILLKL